MALSDCFEDGYNFNEYISQAPTPPSVSGEDWTDCLDVFNFDCPDINEIDYDLTNSQRLTLGQPDPFFPQILPVNAHPQVEQEPQPHQSLEQQVYQSQVNLDTLPYVIKEEPAESVMSFKSMGSNKNNSKRCMNRNAIAARENRAKKKSELEHLKKRNAILEKQVQNYTKEIKELKEKQTRINDRNQYLEKYFRDNLRMSSIYAQISTSDKHKALKKQLLKKTHDNPVGMCLYVRPDKHLEFRMCEFCASHPNPSQQMPTSREISNPILR